MKKCVSLLLCLILLCGTGVTAGEGMDGEAVLTGMWAYLEEGYATLAADMRYEKTDTLINFYYGSDILASAMFNRFNASTGAPEDGPVNQVTVVFLISDPSNETQVNAILLCYGILSGCLKKVFYPETPLTECTDAQLANIRAAAGSETGSCSEEADGYRQTYSVMSSGMVFLTYQVLALDTE